MSDYKQARDLLSEAMSMLLILFDDCRHLDPDDREQSCVSCKAMALCDKIWKELRTRD